MSTFDGEASRLRPLLREAADLHQEFKARWDEGAASMGATAYKETAVYGQTLERFNAAQKRLEAASLPILEALRAGDVEAVVAALAFLSLKYRPFRSGYLSQQIARALKKVELSAEEKRILRRILLDRLTWTWSQPRDLWRLIPGLRTPEFDASLRSLAEHPDPHVRKRAMSVASGKP